MSTRHFFVALPKQCIPPSKKLLLVVWTFVQSATIGQRDISLSRCQNNVYPPQRNFSLSCGLLFKEPSSVNATFLCRVANHNRGAFVSNAPNNSFCSNASTKHKNQCKSILICNTIGHLLTDVLHSTLQLFLIHNILSLDIETPHHQHQYSYI